MKISPIQTNNFIVKNKTNHNKKQNISGLVSFKSDKPKKFNDYDISAARRSLSFNEQLWKKHFYKENNNSRNFSFPKMDSYFSESDINNLKTKWNDDLRKLGVIINNDPQNALQYIAIFIISMGYDISEPVREYMGEKISNKIESKQWIEKIDLIRTDILNAQADENAAKLQIETLKKQRETEQLKEINKVKEEKLYPELLNLIQREKEGKKTKVPNCVMFSNPDDNVNKELINWCGENVNGQFIITNPYEEDLIDVLEEAEKDYQETGDWNLIYVKDMDKLINPNFSKNSVISSMKDIMTCCSEEFHTTLMFSAPNPKKLDDIAIAPHRVKEIDIPNIKSEKFASIEDAKDRLNNEEYKERTPIAAINDILLIAGAKDKMFLTVDISENELKTAKEFVKNNTSDNYVNLFDEISENIWYIKKKYTPINTIQNWEKLNEISKNIEEYINKEYRRKGEISKNIEEYINKGNKPKGEI